MENINVVTDLILEITFSAKKDVDFVDGDNSRFKSTLHSHPETKALPVIYNPVILDFIGKEKLQELFSNGYVSSIEHKDNEYFNDRYDLDLMYDDVRHAYNEADKRKMAHVERGSYEEQELSDRAERRFYDWYHDGYAKYIDAVKIKKQGKNLTTKEHLIDTLTKTDYSRDVYDFVWSPHNEKAVIDVTDIESDHGNVVFTPNQINKLVDYYDKFDFLDYFGIDPSKKVKSASKPKKTKKEINKPKKTEVETNKPAAIEMFQGRKIINYFDINNLNFEEMDLTYNKKYNSVGDYIFSYNSMLETLELNTEIAMQYIDYLKSINGVELTNINLIIRGQEITLPVICWFSGYSNSMIFVGTPNVIFSVTLAKNVTILWRRTKKSQRNLMEGLKTVHKDLENIPDELYQMYLASTNKKLWKQFTSMFEQ